MNAGERTGPTGALARWSASHPWWVVLMWGLALVVAGYAAATLLGGALVTDAKMTSEPESQVGFELLNERLPDFERARETVIITSKLSVEDPAFRVFAEKLVEDLRALGEDTVTEVTSYYETPIPTLVAKDTKGLAIPVTLAGTAEDAEKNIDKVQSVIDKASRHAEFDATNVGGASLSRDFKDVSERDLQTGETWGMGAAAIVLVLVFGSLVSAAIPIGVALVAIAVAVGAVGLLGTRFDFSFFIVNMVTMMGLAVGIDYTLFVVSRFREERAAGRGIPDAVEIAGASASKAVLFSGVTVVLALAGLLLVPSTIFMSLGVGAILVVLAAVAATLTLLPAVLALLGDRIEKLHLPRLGRTGAEREGRLWDALTRRIMNRPVVSLLLAVAVLVTLALPYANIAIGSEVGPSRIPKSAPTRAALELLERDFPALASTPAMLVVDGDVDSPAFSEALARLNEKLSSFGDFGEIAPQVEADRDIAMIAIPILSDEKTEEVNEAIRTLRSDVVPAAFGDTSLRVYVTGDAAGSMDFSDVTNEKMPIVLAVVLGLSFVLLTLLFRSVVVPVKAVLMNLLSVGAAYGVMVLVFQEGVGAEVLGFQRTDVIEAWIPLFLFSVLFGLSMDYHVFMLSRIREHYLTTGDNTESVAFGLRSTGRIITGAAAIMIAVFGGFASGDMVMFQQMGFGLAVAVLLDATIVRSVLVPASMRLLGNVNWYLPRALNWLPRIDVEGPSGPSPRETPPAPAGQHAR